MLHSASNVFSSLRPRLWPVIWLHCFTGFVVAGGRELMQTDDLWLRGTMAAGLWTVFLAGPAVALGSAFAKQNVDDIMHAPGARERSGWTALLLALLGLLLGVSVTWSYWDAYRIGLLLLALYAAPPLCLGARWYSSAPLQALGYGALTFYAGLAVVDSIAFRGTVVPLYLAGFLCLFLALRVFLGALPQRWAPWMYWVAAGAGFVCLCTAGVLAGQRWSAALLIVPLGAWVVAGLCRYDARAPGRFTGAATILGAFAITDAAVALAALIR